MPRNFPRLRKIKISPDSGFYTLLAALTFSYIGLIILLLVADVAYLFQESPETGGFFDNAFFTVLGKEEIRYSMRLTIVSCTITAILSVIVAVPAGYLLSRCRIPFKETLNALVDIPIVLPPLVIGVSLLILFQFWPLTEPLPGMRKPINDLIVYQIPAVILAQFTVAAAFAVRTMKVSFDQLNPRSEEVALTLGCSRFQAFWRVVLPDVRKGIWASGSIAWARALGEFGPLLVFAGATRRKTEVLSTTVFLELSIGNLQAAVAVSLYMVIAALVILLFVRRWVDGAL